MKRDKIGIGFMYSLGTVIVIGFFVILYLLSTKQVPENNREVLYLMLGALIGAFVGVKDYFFGSSQGSKDKTDAMMKNKEQ